MSPFRNPLKIPLRNALRISLWDLLRIQLRDYLRNPLRNSLSIPFRNPLRIPLSEIFLSGFPFGVLLGFPFRIPSRFSFGIFLIPLWYPLKVSLRNPLRNLPRKHFLFGNLSRLPLGIQDSPTKFLPRNPFRIVHWNPLMIRNFCLR